MLEGNAGSANTIVRRGVGDRWIIGLDRAIARYDFGRYGQPVPVVCGDVNNADPPYSDGQGTAARFAPPIHSLVDDYESGVLAVTAEGIRQVALPIGSVTTVMTGINGSATYAYLNQTTQELFVAEGRCIRRYDYSANWPISASFGEPVAGSCGSSGEYGPFNVSSDITGIVGTTESDGLLVASGPHVYYLAPDEFGVMQIIAHTTLPDDIVRIRSDDLDAVAVVKSSCAPIRLVDSDRSLYAVSVPSTEPSICRTAGPPRDVAVSDSGLEMYVLLDGNNYAVASGSCVPGWEPETTTTTTESALPLTSSTSAGTISSSTSSGSAPMPPTATTISPGPDTTSLPATTPSSSSISTTAATPPTPTPVQTSLIPLDTTPPPTTPSPPRESIPPERTEGPPTSSAGGLFPGERSNVTGFGTAPEVDGAATTIVAVLVAVIVAVIAGLVVGIVCYRQRRVKEAQREAAAVAAAARQHINSTPTSAGPSTAAAAAPSTDGTRSVDGATASTEPSPFPTFDVPTHLHRHRDDDRAATASESITATPKGIAVTSHQDGRPPIVGMGRRMSSSSSNNGAVRPSAMLAAAGTAAEGENSRRSSNRSRQTSSLLASTTTLSAAARKDQVLRWIDSGKFQRGRLLGRGANGSVYAVLLKDGSVIAMKEIALFGEPEEVHEQIAAIDRELELLKPLEHPNLVSHYGVRCDRAAMMVRIFMECVPNGSVGTLARGMAEPISDSAARAMVHQVVEGLAYIHEHGVMHRDLKCDNLLRDTSGVVKLADFGTARAAEIRATATMSGGLKGGRGNGARVPGRSIAAQTMIGTPYFMAPEVLGAPCDDTPDADEPSGYGRAADIWSLGITVAEMMNQGNPPWPAFPSPGHAFLHIASKDARPILPDELSDGARDFIERCTQRDPSARPTALELLQHPWLQADPSFDLPEAPTPVKTPTMMDAGAALDANVPESTSIQISFDPSADRSQAEGDQEGVAPCCYSDAEGEEEPPARRQEVAVKGSRRSDPADCRGRSRRDERVTEDSTCAIEMSPTSASP